MKNGLILLFLLIALQSYAQESITTSGGEGGGVVWTIGEPITQTIGDNSTTIVTQGFIQPEYAIPTPTGILNVYTEKFEFSAYPNPVEDKLYLTFQEPIEYVWMLHALSGQKLASGKSGDQADGIDFSIYPAGQYVLTLISAENSRSVLILKK
jgi:hypothetical protein